MKAPRYDLAADMLRVMRELNRPVVVRDFLIHVSGTRYEVAYMLASLRDRDLIDRVEVPGEVIARWKLKGA